MKKLFRLRVSRTTVISSVGATARLTKYVSGLVNFAPTKCAAELVLKILETIKAVDENDDARLLLIRRVVDVLLLIREHFDKDGAIIPEKMGEKMQEFELVLLNIYEKLKPTERRSFFSRAISKDKIKTDLVAHSATLDMAIGKLNLSLLLGVTAVTHMSIGQNSRQPEYSGHSMALTHAPSKDSDEQFLDSLGTLYDEFRISDIQLLPNDTTETAFVSFSDLDYALVKGERRLIKSFDGDDDNERKDWVKELKYWHRLKHPNLLQLQGISNRASPHLFVIFQNAQARCLASYIMNALNNHDVPSVASTVLKLINSSISAVWHIRKKLRVDEASSILAAEYAEFALDPRDNILVSMSPCKQRDKRSVKVSLRHTLQEIFWPPMESRNVPRYLARMKSGNYSTEKFTIKTSQTRTAVNAFLVDHCAYDDEREFHYLKPSLPAWQTGQPIFSASIDCGTHVKAGDYGILVPGQEEDYAFRPYGNANDDSPGVVPATTGTKLSDYTSTGLAEVFRDSPRVWCSDPNETKRHGFANLRVHWYHMQNLTDIQQASRFLITSVALLQCDRPCDIVLITKVTHVKEYQVTIDNSATDGVQEGDNQQAIDGETQPLPLVYAAEPDSPEDELRFSQSPPRPHGEAPSIEDLDSRVVFQGKDRELKRIRYIQLKREDIIKRFGYVPTVAGTRPVGCGAGQIIRRQPQWTKFCREYESVVQRSEAWCGMKAVSKEHP